CELASEILLDRACLIHYHKRSIMDSIKATARTHRRKWATFLSEDRALGDGYEGELAWTEPYVQSVIAGSIRIPPSKDISIAEETNTAADYKIYTDGSLASDRCAGAFVAFRSRPRELMEQLASGAVIHAFEEAASAGINIKLRWVAGHME
ncbi:hypothetical protein FOZ62_016681, partial [Perkinsus olseni]